MSSNSYGRRLNTFKMKSSIVATLGINPPVVTELLQYLDSIGERIADVTVLYTSEPDVEASFEVVRCAIADRYPRVRVHGKRLEFTDVTSTDEAVDFLKFAACVLRDEFVKHRVARVHLNLSGGRKGMAIALATLAQFFSVAGAYLVVARDVKTYNVQLERLRAWMMELASSSDPQSYYAGKRKLFDPVMYPSLKDYRVIRIPIVPYPRPALRALAVLVRAGRSKLADIKLSRDYADMLKKTGIVALRGREVYLTDVGRELVSALKSALEVS